MQTNSPRTRNLVFFAGALLLLAACAQTAPSATPDPVVTNPDTEHEAVFLNAEKVNLRSEASASASILRQLEVNEIVEVLSKSSVSETIKGTTGAWWKVSASGTDGFVFSSFLSEIPLGNSYTYPETSNPWATEKSNNSLEQARLNERKITAALPGRVSRLEGKVTVQCANGKVVEYLDEEGEKGLRYSVMDFFLDKFLIVETQYYEGTSDHLLNLETGAVLGLVGADRRIDKSGRWAAFFSADAEFGVPGLQVVDLKDFRSVFKNGEPAYDVIWKSENEFEARLNTMPTSTYQTYRYSMVMKYGPSGWQTEGAKKKL